MEEKVTKSLELLGINRVEELEKKDLNDIHRQKYRKILDSSLSNTEKVEKINDLYSAKKYLENLDIKNISDSIKYQYFTKRQKIIKKNLENQKEASLVLTKFISYLVKKTNFLAFLLPLLVLGGCTSVLVADWQQRQEEIKSAEWQLRYYQQQLLKLESDLNSSWLKDPFLFF